MRFASFVRDFAKHRLCLFQSLFFWTLLPLFSLVGERGETEEDEHRRESDSPQSTAANIRGLLTGFTDQCKDFSAASHPHMRRRQVSFVSLLLERALKAHVSLTPNVFLRRVQIPASHRIQALSFFADSCFGGEVLWRSWKCWPRGCFILIIYRKKEGLSTYM